MFNSAEISNQDGTPTEMYEFRIAGIADPWRYCAGEEDQTWRGKTYLHKEISNEGITQSGNPDEDTATINLPADLPFMQMLFIDPPTAEITCIIRMRHGTTSDAAPIHLIAEVRTFGRRDAGMAQITVRPLTASFKRSGSRMSWSRQCQNALYDRNCQVKPADHVVNITINSMDLRRIYSTHLEAVKSGALDNGYIEWTNSFGVTQRRSIEANRQNQMTLFGRMTGLHVGMTVKAYPGCARTSKVCDDKFNNINNYGGVPQMSGKSPFTGDPIW